MAGRGGRWTPTNLRPGADRRLLLVVASFGISVVFTRAFLGATGYPRVGVGELHIAHVLFGGALLFVGGLIALIARLDRVVDGAAILIGAGVGLFIDEIGKFITTTNDYFFPTAAPIIYGVFMLSVILLLIVRERFGEALLPVPAAPARRSGADRPTTTKPPPRSERQRTAGTEPAATATAALKAPASSPRPSSRR